MFGKASPVIHFVGAGLVALLLAGCSTGGVATAPTAESTPQVSLPGDQPSPTASSIPSTAEAETGKFSTAVEFTRLVHLDDFGAAGGLAADNSPAARYIAHQNAYHRAYEINGQPIEPMDPNDLTIDGDDKTGAIQITQTDDSDTTRYTWKGFKFDTAGKITSWTGKSGPIDKALWRKTDTAKTHGVTVKLVSAYATNGGDLIAITEISANRAVRVDDAAYTPTDGYRQDDTAGLYSEIDKDEKTLTAFVFPKATIGGKLRLEIGRIDPNDTGSSYELGTVTLNVS